VLTSPTRGRSFPATSPDTEFFWEGARQGKLLAQQCLSCRELRHPPGPACPFCHSLDYDIAELSGRGVLYSYAVQRHPPAPGFDGPALVVVVELEEGVRLVSNLVGVDPDDVKIGEPLEVFFVNQEEGWTAPQFRRSSA
jgi:uncharacterized OB-fold protein